MDNKKINYEQWHLLRAKKILSKTNDPGLGPEHENEQDHEGNSKMKGRGGRGAGRGKGKGKFGGRFAGRGRWGKR